MEPATFRALPGRGLEAREADRFIRVLMRMWRVCVYVCMCVCVHIYIYMCMCVCVCEGVFVCIISDISTYAAYKPASTEGDK